MMDTVSLPTALATDEEQCVYHYFLSNVDFETPKILIERFCQLFFEGKAQTQPEVEHALTRYVLKLSDEQTFGYLLNRCFHILINRWLMQPHDRHCQSAIATLITQFATVPAFTQTDSLTVKRLRYRAQHFLNSEHYGALRRLCLVVHPIVAQPTIDSPPLVKWVSHYPYLYEQTLLTPESTPQERQQVLTMRVTAHSRLRRHLLRYAQRQWSRQAILNPTRLSDQQLDLVIRQFTNKVSGHQTYRDLAQQFHTYSLTAPTFGQFKQDLFSYLAKSIEPTYGRIAFYRRLHERLQTIMPDYDRCQPSDGLRLTACHQILNFLVVENTSRLEHSTFVDLISNQGALNTVILLMKIILFCKMARLHLERQFALLFQHYETCQVNNVGWLVECLENLNVALSLYLQA